MQNVNEKKAAEFAAKTVGGNAGNAARRMNRFDDHYVEKVETGFKALDDVTGGGLSAPGFYVVGAVSSLGKTTFAMQLAENVSAGGRHVIALSLETPAIHLTAKAVSREMCLEREAGGDVEPKTAGQLLDRKASAAMTDAEWDAVENAAKTVAAKQELITVLETDGTCWTVEELSDYVEWYVETMKPAMKPLVVIDYLQLIEPPTWLRGGSDKSVTDHVVKGLGKLALKNGIAVLAISSFNRSNYEADADMDAFKESGMVEYHATGCIALVYSGAGKRGFNVNAARAKDVREVELKVLKQRLGPAGVRMPFEFEPAHSLFRETGCAFRDENAQRSASGKPKRSV